MFKKKCNNCKKKIDKGYDFCPFCGNNITNQKDYGILGKSDIDSSLENNNQFGFPMMDKLFKTAEKMVEKMMENQMKDMPKDLNKLFHQKKLPNSKNPFSNIDVQFFVNGKPVNVSQPNKQIMTATPKKIQNKMISREKIEKFSKLPKKTPESKVRRLSGKLIYEFVVPGVKEIEDIIITPLETSIEIKALSEKTVYSKTINVKLPIIGYRLKKELLILELAAQ